MTLDLEMVFSAAMSRDFAHVFAQDAAIGVSGGPDSVALCALLSDYYAREAPDRTIYALTVDHALRPESAAEAEKVADLCADMPNVRHKVLKWQHDGDVNARIQESARHARYQIMEDEMRVNDVKHLFLGHHIGDQAETFLFRLAKGSGLDGLSCMQSIQPRDNMFLCRPLLGVPKEALVSFCDQRDLRYIEDPSNKSDDFARVRLRGAMQALEAEGLSAKRLGVTAARMARARGALDEIADKAFDNALRLQNTKRIVFNFKELILNHKEVFLRVILKAMLISREKSTYSARMERVEALCDDLMGIEPFRKRTLGGVIFSREGDELHLIREKDA